MAFTTCLPYVVGDTSTAGEVLTDTTALVVIKWTLPTQNSGMVLSYTGFYLSITATGGKTFNITYRITKRAYPTKYYPVSEWDSAGEITKKDFTLNTTTLPTSLTPMPIPEDTYILEVTFTATTLLASPFTLEVLGSPSLL